MMKMCARAVNGSEQLSYWYSDTFTFLECSSVLNTTPVTNAFLNCILLSMFFFSDYVLGKHLAPSSMIFHMPVSVWVVFSPST